MCQLTSSSTSTENGRADKPLPFMVHSTYRHKDTDKPLRPTGLQWNLPGRSHVKYVCMLGADGPALRSLEELGDDEWHVKRGIVEAHNRWAFAREESFAKVEDIQSMAFENDGQHIHVTWKPALRDRLFKEEGFRANMQDLIKKDPAAAPDGDAAEVWINGLFVGNLCGPASVPPILEALSIVTSRRLAYKRSDDGIIRIERYFGSYLRQKDEIFDHVLDNLIAMEDAKCIDPDTLIGTATLKDWIMGGRLTSRIWVRNLDDRIRFLRPLYNDDIGTTDRKFELIRGKDDDKIALVEAELQRLQQLASMRHPFEEPSSEQVSKDPLAEVRESLMKNRPRRKFFGM